ncbi:MAG: hypothetical protein R3B06_10845 [Kofleriaceae bacterium]
MITPREPTDLSVEVDLLDGVDVGLRSLFRRLGPIIPADPHVLVTMWPDRRPPTSDELARGIDRLLKRRVLRIIFLAGEPHLTALPRYDTASDGRAGMEHEPAPELVAKGSAPAALGAGAAAAGSTSAEADASAEQMQLELAIDAERERVVLYRVIIVMEVLAALVFARFLWL